MIQRKAASPVALRTLIAKTGGGMLRSRRQRMARVTYMAAAIAIVLIAVSFFLPSHLAWFLRGFVLGMVLSVELMWARKVRRVFSGL